ncbi:MAG: nitrile hydratase accessory protein [Aestuariivirga sp.]
MSFGKVTLFRPENPLAPRGPVFDEPWQAQVLAMADAMVRAGHFSSAQWTLALGAALCSAEAEGAPDSDETYYTAVLVALETLSEAKTEISAADLAERKHAWEDAYLKTPHGKPVVLQLNKFG